MWRTFVGVFAFVHLVASFGSPARAEATIVQNRDEPGRNVYQAHATFSAACGFNGCVATFPAIEPNRHVVAQFLSCWLVVPSGVSPILAALDGLAKNPAERLYVPATYQGALATTASWVVSSPILFYYSGGDTPTVSVLLNGTAGTSIGDCVLTGYHVLLP